METMNPKIAMAQKLPLVKQPLFLDGVSRGGKFLLGKIVGGLENVEFFQAISALEHLPILQRLGVINKDGAISLMQINLDEHAYYMHIGRNLNLRYDDASSLYNSPNLNDYLKRALTPITPDFIEAIQNSQNYSSFLVHECMPHISLFFQAFSNLSWITIVRNPVDVVHSWHVRGWGHRLLSDPLSFIPMLESNAGPVPWYFRECGEDYHSLSGIDRIIRSVVLLSQLAAKEYEALSVEQKNRILFVPYEALVEKTIEQVDCMSSFLGCKPLKEMALILARERCPRLLPTGQRDNKISEIKHIASPAIFRMLIDLSENYQESHNISQ